MFRVLINTCILLFGFTITIAAQDEAAEVPLNNPFKSFSAPPIREVKISKALVATIKNGDFVHPTFSPDAKLLAYSKVLLKGGFESTEVLLTNLSTHRQSVLLNSRRAETYGTYKAFVTGMQWRSARRLEVSMGDGDVGLTHLILDPVNRKLLQERVEDLDETETAPLSPSLQKAYQQAQRLFPSFPGSVLENELRTTALVIPDQGIVMQDYADRGNNISFLDFQNKSVRALINLPADAGRAFDGGVSFKSSIILVLSRGPKTYLFLYRDGKIRGLGEFKSKGVHQIEVKHVTPSRVIFLIRTHAASERGDNPLFIFDGSQLLRIKEHSELYDAEVDRGGRRIAYCYWVGDKRHIVVKELKSNVSQEPRAETFAFVHRETTGITSYVTIRGKQKPIMFRADSDPFAMKSLHALNWRIFLPNSNGKKLFLVGQYFAEPKRTPNCDGCTTSEIYNEFRLIGWYILVPFKVVPDDCENCAYLLEENLRTKRSLELNDFQDFEGRNGMDVRRFQRDKGRPVQDRTRVAAVKVK